MKSPLSWIARTFRTQTPATSPDAASSLVMAAGGLVWRGPDGGRHLAIVHRPQYDDWTLPKGKVERGEGYEAAALREVKEETGCDAVLGAFAGTVSYATKGSPKVVLFWHMEAAGDPPAILAPDVDQVLWLTPRDAVKQLSHAAEREVVMQTTTGSRPPRSLWRRMTASRPGWMRDERLAGSLAAYALELDRLIQECAVDGKASRSWADASRRLLDRVRTSLDSGEPEAGWECFLAAQRMEVYGLAHARNGGLESRARVVLAEASSKLTGWRKAAVETLLTKDGALRAGLGPAEVYAATHVLHEHFRNQYRRLRITYTQLGLLGLVGAGALVVWLLLGPPISSGQSGSSGDVHGLAPAVVLLGILGACVSGIVSLARESTVKRIPEQLLALTVTACRPVVGAIAALGIYIFALSPLGPRLFAEHGGPSLLLFLAFASGASERLIDRAVQEAAKESLPGEKK